MSAFNKKRKCDNKSDDVVELKNKKEKFMCTVIDSSEGNTIDRRTYMANTIMIAFLKPKPVNDYTYKTLPGGKCITVSMGRTAIRNVIPFKIFQKILEGNCSVVDFDLYRQSLIAINYPDKKMFEPTKKSETSHAKAYQLYSAKKSQVAYASAYASAYESAYASAYAYAYAYESAYAPSSENNILHMFADIALKTIKK